MFISKSPLVRVAAVCFGSILFISGCGNSAPEASLIKDCEQLNLNLLSIKETPSLYKIADPSDVLNDVTTDGYFITNIGDETRSRNKAELLAKYSFVAREIKDLTYYSGVLDNIIKFKILKEAIKNTGFKIELTQAEIQSIKGDYEDPSADLVQREIDRIIGAEIYDENDEFVGNSGCAEVASYKDGLSQEDSEGSPFDYEKDDPEFLWVRATDAVEFAIETIIFTNVCEQKGSYGGSQCARKDYISSGDYTLPAPTKVNPWSRSWSSPQQEALAKTVWCIENGYRNYIYSQDACTNTISR